MREVAITGIGLVSVLGTGCAAVTRSLREGACGIVADPRRRELGFRSPLTGQVQGYVPPQLELRKRKTMTEFAQQAFLASQEALAQAGWSESEVQSPRTGLVIGNDSSSLANWGPVDTTLREKSTFSIGASSVFQALNSTVTMNLNALLGTRGASFTLSGACASGGHAIGLCRDWIGLGRQDRALCGGTQEITWEGVASFDATNAFSLRAAEPARASRPFDASRDGLVPSGGAALVCLEALDAAQARGAKVLGRVRAWAFSSDGAREGKNLALPTGEGLERAMRECLELGGARPADVDYICAHATSTPLGDMAEARAIHNVFGPDGPPVSSLKGHTGHEMWMSGAAQVAYTCLMAQGGFIAPNLNFERQEEGASRIAALGRLLPRPPRLALLNAAGFGGTNSCLLLDFHGC
jgi:3-oxoacyl-[acyl-carrier-protein] synthase-1